MSVANDHGQSDRQPERQSDRQSEGQGERQPDRQGERQPDRRAAALRALRLRGGPPTEPMPLVELLRRTPYRRASQGLCDTDPGDEAIPEVLDFAARIGELMLRCGAGAAQVEGSVVAVAAAYGLRRFEMDLTMQSLLLQARDAAGESHTLLRVARTTRPDHARLVAIHELVETIVSGSLELGEAEGLLREIKAAPRTFRTWVVWVARACLAAAVAAMVGANVTATLITFLVVMLVSLVHRATLRVWLPEFYESAIVAASSTAFAWLAYAAGAQGWIDVGQRDFAYIVAGGIVALLPGRALASAVEDVLSTYAVTGAGRFASVFISLLGLIIGVALAISVTLQITTSLGVGFATPDALRLELASASVPVVLIGGFVVGASGAATLQTRRKLVLPVGLVGLLGLACSLVGTRVLVIGPVTTTGVAAVVIGVVGTFVARGMGAPAMTVVVPASFGLLPGLTIFLGLYEMVGQDTAGALTLQSGMTTLLTAGAVLMAIATGTTLGEILASSWGERLGPGRAPARRR